jgi:hypothetical protein
MALLLRNGKILLSHLWAPTHLSPTQVGYFAKLVDLGLNLLVRRVIISKVITGPSSTKKKPVEAERVETRNLMHNSDKKDV